MGFNAALGNKKAPAEISRDFLSKIIPALFNVGAGVVEQERPNIGPFFNNFG